MPIKLTRAKAPRRWRKKLRRDHALWREIEGEPPVDVATFTASPRYLNADPLFPRQASVLKRFFDESKGYTELALKWGKSSGKDYVAACGIAYMVYLTLRLPDPQAHYGLAAGDPIDFVNVAYNAKQARDVFFKRFKARLNGSPWFKKVGFKPTRDAVEFPRSVMAHSMHSQNESYEGFNILGAVMDEAAAFKSTTNVANADKIYNTLKTTITSRFGRHGKLMMLSYTRHAGDFIERKYEESLKFDFVLGDAGATWEINPRRKREDFADDYLRDPITAAGTYECIPPLTVDAFLDPDKIDDCVGERKSLDPMGYDKKTPRVVTLDPGVVHDRYALVICHWDRHQEKVVEDYVHAWQGSPKKPVKIAEVEAHLVQLNSRYRVIVNALDQHQSASTIQRLRDAREVRRICDDLRIKTGRPGGLPMEETVFTHGYNQKIFKNLRELVVAEAIDLLDHELQTLELKNLQIKRGGDSWSVKAPDSGLCTTDDIADALANCAFLCMEHKRKGKPGDFIFI